MKKAIKLTQQQLRQLIMQEAKRLVEAPPGKHFEIQDMPHTVEQDGDLVEAIRSLVEALAYFCEQLAVKEGLVGEENRHEVSDFLIPEADSAIREAVYDFVSNALDSVSDMGVKGEF
jgi:hypothetical protein